jgi:hypothetical protein
VKLKSTEATKGLVCSLEDIKSQEEILAKVYSAAGLYGYREYWSREIFASQAGTIFKTTERCGPLIPACNRIVKNECQTFFEELMSKIS